jgi:MFS family permease
MIGGSLLASAGFLLSSIATSVDALFITIGLMGGLGFGLIYFASSVAVSLYINKEKRAFATGIAMCGSGTGTFLFAPLMAWLLKNYALRGTFLITVQFI